MLAELMRGRRGIAIAGTHGKTTTSALVASVLQQAGADPSWVIGGRPQGTASNARLGGGDTLVVEADESDASFLLLSPVVAVVTNIDADHMQTYGHDLGRLHAAFVDFVHRLPFYGRAIVCTDDAGVRAVLARLERPCIRYGMHADADLRATQVQAGIGGGMRFVALRRGAADLPVALNLAGEHNVRNALAAIGVAMALGLPDGPVLQALASFGGVGRRFERHGELAAAGGGHYTLIDDYGHHPVEIGAVLEAARAAFPSRRIVIAFQPHRYSRTRDCFDDFVAVLGRFDAVLLTEVYAAGEVPVQGADAASLLRALRAASAVDAELVDDVARLPAAICRSARAGDVVITMGAGSIGAVAGQLEQMQELAR
jgi:UDP-N-acetylmuramate--alanine ligase